MLQSSIAGIDIGVYTIILLSLERLKLLRPPFDRNGDHGCRSSGHRFDKCSDY